MFIRSGVRLIGHGVAVLAAAVALTAIAPARPALAQGFLDAVFGGIDRAIRRELSMPPRVSSYSNPFGFDDRRRIVTGSVASQSGEGRSFSSGFCVRSCDGFGFAVRTTGNMSAAEMCRAFCPAAQTRVYGGSKLDHSVAGDGTRYADTDTAFLYRERAVDNCTCNGRYRFGLATLDPASDPTLKPGDIVATNEGLATYTGNRKTGSGEFTPIAQSGGSSELRNRLLLTKVTPAPPRAEIAVAPPEVKPARPESRRAQR